MAIGRTNACAASGASLRGREVTVSYSGTMSDENVTLADGKMYRLLTLTSSGTLTFDSAQVEKGIVADVWLCGGGMGGGGGYTNGSSFYAGLGGSGAFADYIMGKRIDAAELVAIVGAGGAGAASGGSIQGSSGGESRLMFLSNGSYINAICNTSYLFGSGYGGSGGTYCNIGSAGDGLANKRPFIDTGFPLCCSGGGGGGFLNTTKSWRYTGGAGGENGGNGSDCVTLTSGYPAGGAGGSGAGNGGNCGSGSSVTAGSDATTYGSGGGGGAYNNGTCSAGGAGKQGVIYIRMAY